MKDNTEGIYNKETTDFAADIHAYGTFTKLSDVWLILNKEIVG